MTRGKSPSTRRTIQIQDRDIALLRDLFESRIMTLAQAAALHFDGRPEAAKKRIQKLKADGLIGARPRRAYDPSILHLTGKAFRLLQERGALEGLPRLSMKAFERRKQVSDQTLRHELEVMNVKAALVSAINKSDRFRIAEFSTWPVLNEFQVRWSAIDKQKSGELLVKPDGFIRIHEREPDGGLSEHLLFLEVDRSNESQAVLAQKALCYLDYYRSGRFAERFGAKRSAFEEYPFRVLFVMPNIERRNNTAERLLQNNPPTLTQVWLTTSPEVTANPLGAIWITPKDYRDAVQRSTSNAYTPSRNQRDRRQDLHRILLNLCRNNPLG